MNSPQNGQSSVLLDVQGLCCNEEKVLIEKKVRALDGVADYDVDVIMQRLRVDYDPTRLSPQDIIKTVAETGMKALATGANGARFIWWKEPRIVLLALSGLLTTIAFVGMTSGMPTLLGRTLYVLAIISGGFYPAKAGLSAARTMSMNINTLLILGVVGAVGLDLWDEAAILVFVYSLGNVLEAYVVKKARGAVKSFVDLSPKEALVKQNGAEVVMPADRLRIGDKVLVRPGEKIPIDGVVEDGESYVNEGAVTGESIAVLKSAGGQVFAGTVNEQGSLTVRVTHEAQDTTLAKIIHSIEEAHAKKSKYQLFGEKFSRVYTPVMFLVGVLVAIVPPILFAADWQSWVYRALVVFVVSCSCGLALSVPVAIVAAVGNAARHGILLKGGVFIEKTQKTAVVAFDKTGTLTIGKPSVTDIATTDNITEADLLSVAASIEALSEHPLGQAIVRKAKETDRYLDRAVNHFEAVPGRGVRGSIDGEMYLVGSAKFLKDNAIDIEQIADSVQALESSAKTPVIVANTRHPLGVFGVADIVKHESEDAIRNLREQGLDVVMLTGDTRGTAEAIAKSVGIDEYHATLMPQDKIDRVIALHDSRGPVMMVGDGINDSPAMATSDVGVAMGAAGTDIAMETGDVVLLADDLSRVPWLIRLSRRTVSNIRQNILISLVVIALLVPAALLGKVSLLTGLVINEGAAVLVILNGLRLIR